jgi:hypothetical protein
MAVRDRFSLPSLEDYDQAPSYYKTLSDHQHWNLSPSEVAGRDETRVSPKKGKQKKAKPKAQLLTSRIRVQLSRPLTWAEKEHLETNWTDPNLRRISDVSPVLKLRVAENKEHVWLEAPFGSRIAFELLAAAVEQHFVNVFPKAVRTFREYNGE